MTVEHEVKFERTEMSLIRLKERKKMTKCRAEKTVGIGTSWLDD